VNEDQLSLAIGKRGQNVRLAARLTGWDVDILTPTEFQNGTTRLDQTLKQIEGIIQEHVDKVIALGLIDVRDIEEVGVGPLMEELGLDEELATRVVERCGDEAKIVAQEQEAKKAADAAAKAANAAAVSGALGGPLNPTGEPNSRGVDAVAFANPLLQQAPISDDEISAEQDGADRMHSPLEATEGIAPEITTHDERALTSGSELSPEEQAIHGLSGSTEPGDEAATDFDEDDAEAALAEGRVPPPAPMENEPTGEI
jgi:N utilization substance protein A